MIRFSRPVSAGSTAAAWPARPITWRTRSGWAAASMPVTRNVPASGSEQRGNGPHERGLAGAVRTQDRRHGSGRRDEIQPVERHNAAERLAEACGLDGGNAHIDQDDAEKWSSGVHFRGRPLSHARRSPRGHAAGAPGQGPHHGCRAGRRAGGVRQDGTAGSGSPRHRRHPRVLPARQGRWMDAARRLPHRPLRTHRSRGADVVHDRRTVVDGDP